jgi:murein DD-endopeptidase MepM/ murein hydrolase activator NlpD
MTDLSHEAVRRDNLERANANGAATAGDPNPRLPHAFNGRWTRRHWLHASLFATIGALAASIVPGFSTAMQSPAHVQRMTLSLPLPQLGKKQGATSDHWQSVSLKPGQTLSGVFTELGIPQRQLQDVMEHPKIQPMLRRMRPGTELSFNLPADGSVRAMRIDMGKHGVNGEPVELEFDGNSVREHEVAHDVTTRTVVLSGVVGKSLFTSARAVGLGSKQLSQLTDEMFKYDIDFDSDLEQNDRFSVVVDQTWKDGQLVNTGPVLAATFTMGAKLKSAFRYMRDGKPEYFTPDGRSLKRPFIRMPIAYARITSGFGMRNHPILGRMRAHQGIDYAAGTGTPIMAAGDARVEFVGRKGGYGNAVILNHGGGRTTLYGHMSRFAHIHAGQRVAQGTVIGYVGSTGLATGPHLHYEFRVNGVHMNPTKMTLPSPEPLSGSALVAFKHDTRRALDKIREVENVIYVPEGDTRVAATSPRAKGNKKG